MNTVNMPEAKSTLSQLVDAIEQGQEKEIILARNGRPVARLVPLETRPLDIKRRLGVAKGRFEVPDSIDARNDEITDFFAGREGA